MEKKYLRKAIKLAAQNVKEKKGGPFGAVIVKEGRVIAEGQNRVTAASDPTAHAEIEAIRKASRKLGRFHLSGCVLYASCEPCPMCLSAIYWAHLDAVYFAANAENAADAGFDDGFIYDELGKAPEDRQLKIEKLDLPESIEPFQLWDNDPDKIEY